MDGALARSRKGDKTPKRCLEDGVRNAIGVSAETIILYRSPRLPKRHPCLPRLENFSLDNRVA